MRWATWSAVRAARCPARVPAHRLALRHRAQRRQVRRPPGHLRADGLRARARAPGRRLPFGIEVVGFAEEEGQRYKATFLGSGALIGHFDPPGWSRRTPTASPCARPCARRPAATPSDPALKRDPSRYLGFVEVHIEQGPVLNELDLPLGIVTSINGGVRYVCEVIGMASHAGTTPMDRRRDAAVAVAELALYVEQRAARDGDSVGTIGMLKCPTAPSTWCRAAASSRWTCARRTTAARRAGRRRAGEAEGHLRAPRPAPRRGNHARRRRAQRARVAAALGTRRRALGVPLYRMPSGAGHDAMKLHEVMPQAMLFVRGRTRASATTRWNPPPATTSSWACRPSSTCWTTWPKTLKNNHDRLRQSSTPGSTPTSTRKCASCRNWCACPPTRRPATTRRTPSAPPNC
jgi:N-carbamoyl-L-amino-acid hydrolase